MCWLHSQGQFMDSGRLCGWLQPQLQCSLETTSACSANKVSSHPRTLHSISLTDNHAHMLTGDKVTGPYMYACSVIVPPQIETLPAVYYLLSHNVRRQQINLPPGSASFRGGAFPFCAAASRTCSATNPVVSCPDPALSDLTRKRLLSDFLVVLSQQS